MKYGFRPSSDVIKRPKNLANFSFVVFVAFQLLTTVSQLRQEDTKHICLAIGRERRTAGLSEITVINAAARDDI